MPDQRATTDQLQDLARLLDEELPEAASWVRTWGKEGLASTATLHLCIQKANQNGFYDAADWIRNWMGRQPERLEKKG